MAKKNKEKQTVFTLEYNDYKWQIPIDFVVYHQMVYEQKCDPDDFNWKTWYRNIKSNTQELRWYLADNMSWDDIKDVAVLIEHPDGDFHPPFDELDISTEEVKI